MENNIFIKNEKRENFSWGCLGDIKEGRRDLGNEMPVFIYRLMEYTMMDVLTKAHGYEQACEHFRQSGFLAGYEFAKNILDLKAELNVFVANLQKIFLDFKIGILRVEEFNSGSGSIVLTVEQDLDCSGLPVTSENVCVYDEGFIAGILEAYTGKKYNVREVDCWANGDRICRFKGIVTV